MALSLPWKSTMKFCQISMSLPVACTIPCGFDTKNGSQFLNRYQHCTSPKQEARFVHIAELQDWNQGFEEHLGTQITEEKLQLLTKVPCMTPGLLSHSPDTSVVLTESGGAKLKSRGADGIEDGSVELMSIWLKPGFTFAA